MVTTVKAITTVLNEDLKTFFEKQNRTNQDKVVDTRSPRMVKDYPYIHVRFTNSTSTPNSLNTSTLRTTQEILINIYVLKNQDVNIVKENEENVVLNSEEILEILTDAVIDILTGKRNSIVNKIKEYNEDKAVNSFQPTQTRRVEDAEHILRNEITVTTEMVKGKQTQ